MRTDRVHLGLVIGALLAGCAGTLDDPERYDVARQESQPSATPSCADIAGVPTTILGARCATAGCHDASAGSAAKLDLASPQLHARLTGKAATGGAGVLVDVANKQKAQAAARAAKLDLPLPETPLALRILVARALAASGDKRARPYVLALAKQVPKHPYVNEAALELK